MYDNWLYRWWYKKKLRKYMNQPFKIRNEANALKCSALINIVRITDRKLKEAEVRLNKLITRQKKEAMFEKYRDQFGNEKTITRPIFQQNEVEDAKSIVRRFFAAILLFVLFESVLWYFVADLFVSEGLQTLKILMAIFLGLIFMRVLERATELWSEYRLAEVEHNEERMTEIKFKKYKDNKKWAILLTILILLALIIAGISRLYFLEGYDPAIYGAEEAKRLNTLFMIAGIFLLILNIVTAIYLASISQKYNEIKIKYKIYRNWVKHNRKIKKYVDDLRELIIDIANGIKYYIERFWQLVIEMKRIYGQECDDDKMNLYDEYKNLKIAGNFNITKDIYVKYEDIQSTDKELWEFGINLDSQLIRINEKITAYNTKINEFKEITANQNIKEG